MGIKSDIEIHAAFLSCLLAIKAPTWHTNAHALYKAQKPFCPSRTFTRSRLGRRFLYIVFFVIAFSVSANRRTPAPSSVDATKEQLERQVANSHLSDTAALTACGEDLYLQVKEKLLFARGAFRLTPEGSAFLKSIGPTLDKVPETHHISIEGHTDDEPVHGDAVADNWELSVRRAHAVLTALEQNQRQNRRVTIRIFKP